MTRCKRCNQPRTPDQLSRGICGTCRAHTCTRHPRGTRACYADDGCRCGRCTRSWYSAEQSRKHYAAQGVARRLPAIGTQRRIQALWALGWTSEAIGRAAGLAGKAVWQIAGNRRWVNRATADAISRAYKALSMLPGPSAVTAARASHYPPPLAWDDGTGPHGIDNPDATPYTTRHDDAETVFDKIAWLVDGGESLATITARLGTSPSAVEAACRRAGRPDMWARINVRKAA